VYLMISPITSSDEKADLNVTTVNNCASASAQCAMCRATLENNLSNGNIGIAAGINVE